MAWLLWVLCWVLRPVAWTAPDGWWVNGVRPDGTFEARPVLGAADADLDDAHARRQIVDDRALQGRVWCRTGSPRQDGLRVWCAP